MKQILTTSLMIALCAATAEAACFADYKAKRDDPLRLHYGVAEVTEPCTPETAEAELAPKLAEDDWQLLSIEGVFDDAGLEERQDSAGDYYLRY